jgi:CRISPR-associated endonuclease Cas1
LEQQEWLTVTGVGAHIKSTPAKLVIQRDGIKEEIPFPAIRHLMIMGRHIIHTVAIAHLVIAGCRITFFESDGTPIGYIKGYGGTYDPALREAQKSASRHSYAVEIAKSSLKSRIRAVQEANKILRVESLYEGELEVLHSALEEMEYLIKLEEIRRLHRLTSYMYYEIMARLLPPSTGFRRRTTRPHQDPINAILSFGYSMLYGNCCVSTLGADLDPDTGMLYEGKGGLLYDLIEPLKATLIDPVVFYDIGRSLQESDVEYSDSRCILSDALMQMLSNRFRVSINQKRVDEQVMLLRGALLNQNPITIIY